MRRFAFHREDGRERRPRRRGAVRPFRSACCTLFTSAQLLSEHPEIKRNRKKKKVSKSREQSRSKLLLHILQTLRVFAFIAIPI